MGKFSQFGKIGRPPIHRRMVKLVIARMDNESSRGSNAKAHTIGNAVGHVERLYCKDAHLKHIPRLNGVNGHTF